MPYLVTAARQLFHTLDLYTHLARGPLDRRQGSGEPDKGGIEPIEIAPDPLLFVAGRIRGDEYQLDLVSISRCQSLQSQRGIREYCDTYVRAVGVSEEQQADRLGRGGGEVVRPSR